MLHLHRYVFEHVFNVLGQAQEIHVLVVIPEIERQTLLLIILLEHCNRVFELY